MKLNSGNCRNRMNRAEKIYDHFFKNRNSICLVFSPADELIYDLHISGVMTHEP
jgi:hypothetical protein